MSNGQIQDILKRIYDLKAEAWLRFNKEPNTIYMNMADYRELCEWSVHIEDKRDNSTKEICGQAKLREIFGMRIAKRSGEMECAFDESLAPEVKPIGGACVHGNDFMTCAKCIPPIT